MFNWLSTELLAMQELYLAGELSLMVIEWNTVEYCFDKSFNFLIPNRNDWTHDTTVPDDSKLNCGVGSFFLGNSVSHLSGKQ